MSSFFKHLNFVRPIILRITSPMLMGLTNGFLSTDTNLHASYGFGSSGFSSSLVNLLVILAIVLKISTGVSSVLKYVSIQLNQGQVVHENRACEFY